MKGLILSGGRGTRLRPITHTLQKQLVPIANRPIIFYVIDDLVEAGISEIGIVVGPNKEQVMETVGDGSRWGEVKISYIEQDEPLGLAHAVMISKDFLGDDEFVMYLGDNILKGGIVDFVTRFRESGADASLMLTPVDNPQQFGVAELNDAGEIVGVQEKPEKPVTNLAVVGIYAYTPVIHEACAALEPSDRGEYEISEAHQWLLDNGKTIQSAQVSGWWKDTGRPEDLLEGNQLILDDVDTRIDGDVEDDAIVKGRVVIEKGARVGAGSRIQGPVVIGEGAVVEESYVGSYTSIGANVKLEGTEIEHSIVMDDAVISTGRRIVDSLIGQNAQITAVQDTLPQGHRIVVGDNSEIEV